MTKDLISGLVSLILGIGYLLYTFLLPKINISDPVGPYLFPELIGIGAVICGIILIYLDLKKTNRIKISAYEIFGGKDVTYRIILTTVAGLIYGVILDPIGYIISTVVFMMMVMSIINGLNRILENVGISIAFSVITYLFFGTFLKLSIPRGIFWF
ncbi:MAG: tripartite tricarboxylate transporter TctB family protein [Thermoanaerobacteraceae bacterium]|nr:tripartite tricarboxylate transporter TctB family protein [Thermoanaerobacteraceae bacterium]